MDCTISQFVDTTFLASQEIHNGRKGLFIFFNWNYKTRIYMFKVTVVTYPEDRNSRIFD